MWPRREETPGRSCECMAEQKLNVCSSSLSQVPLPKRWPVAVADPFSSCSFTRTEILLPAKNCSVKYLLSPLQFLCHFWVSRELDDLLPLWLSLLWNASESVFSFLKSETHIMYSHTFEMVTFLGEFLPCVADSLSTFSAFAFCSSSTESNILISISEVASVDNMPAHLCSWKCKLVWQHLLGKAFMVLFK